MLVNSALIDSVNYAINYLKYDLSLKQYRIGIDESRLAVMRHALPYALQETATNGIYIILNRQYQLLGSSDNASIPAIKYCEYPDAHIKLTSTQVDSVLSNSHGLFSDVSAPWLNRKKAKAYLIRLQNLHCLLTSSEREIRQ